MIYFLATFALMLIVIAVMAIGVIFGRNAIKGSCGGTGSKNCLCVKRCDKKKEIKRIGITKVYDKIRRRLC